MTDGFRRMSTSTACIRILLAFGPALAAQQLTVVPTGRMHVHGNSLVDSAGRKIVLRGTEVPDSFSFPMAAEEFGSLSATTFSTIRHRWNMNAIRIAVNPERYLDGTPYRTKLREAIQTATSMDLVAILGTDQPSASLATQFWSECALDFQNNPRVIFEIPASTDLILLIRSKGQTQPILVRGPIAAGMPDVIQEISSVFAGSAVDGDLEPFSAGPLLVRLDDSNFLKTQCSSANVDPSHLESLVEENLALLDKREVSWIASSFRPARLIGDYRYYDATTLENGCGEQPPHGSTGIGMAVQFHLWNIRIRGLFIVSGPTGNFVLPRGGLAVAYGPILAKEEAGSTRNPLPLELGGIAVQVTDSRGKARLAGLVHVLGGWGQVNFVVPTDSAPGSARIAILRKDGSTVTGTAIIADVAPGLSSKGGNGRGPAIGEVIQRSGQSASHGFIVGECKDSHCWTYPIRLAPDVRTELRLVGNGFRNARASSEIEVKIGGIRVPVLSYGPFRDAGMDQVCVSLPDKLHGLGESDLIVSVDGHISNVVRIRIE